MRRKGGLWGQGNQESAEGALRDQKKQGERGSDAGEGQGGVDRIGIGESERLRERNSELRWKTNGHPEPEKGKD